MIAFDIGVRIYINILWLTKTYMEINFMLSSSYLKLVFHKIFYINYSYNVLLKNKIFQDEKQETFYMFSGVTQNISKHYKKGRN